ncbi:hypothetical protein E2C01_017486 [Portunus trituberculatus]|uniref:Uncharacterized protein n=1 Tax=Portunus trituberculatus TaxID=210409 RepID=A0A5B7DSZ8_PORTR|nr:hypothetical protein [Portunus trituberculatus]
MSGGGTDRAGGDPRGFRVNNVSRALILERWKIMISGSHATPEQSSYIFMAARLFPRKKETQTLLGIEERESEPLGENGCGFHVSVSMRVMAETGSISLVSYTKARDCRCCLFSLLPPPATHDQAKTCVTLPSGRGGSRVTPDFPSLLCPAPY